MKELIIFIIIFLFVFTASVFIFNGRFIYAQIKYSFIGPAPTFDFHRDILFKGLVKEKDVFPQKISVPSIGIEAPIVISGSSDNISLQKDLEKGVIYLPGSAPLNEKGNIVIMGHSSAYPWYRGQYGSIFALLNNLNPGDEIFILSSKGKAYTYQVVGKEVKAPKDLVFQVQEDESVLYLVSCWPINTAWKRIVIKAVAIDRN